MKKILFFMLIFFFIICSNESAQAGDRQFSVSIGCVQPLLNIKKIGDEFFAPGIGKEWEEIIMLKDVGPTYFISGRYSIVKIKYLILEVEGNYWKKNIMTKPELYDFIDVKNLFRDFSLGANAIFKFKKRTINPFFGSGISFHFVKAEINPIQYPELSRSASAKKIMLAVLGGIEIALSKNISLQIASHIDLPGGWAQWKIYSGFSFSL